VFKFQEISLSKGEINIEGRRHLDNLDKPLFGSVDVKDVATRSSATAEMWMMPFKVTQGPCCVNRRGVYDF